MITGIYEEARKETYAKIESDRDSLHDDGGGVAYDVLYEPREVLDIMDKSLAEAKHRAEETRLELKEKYKDD